MSKAREEEDEQKRSLPGGLAWYRFSLFSKDPFPLPRNWQEKCWPSKFQISLGHYLTSRMLGLILALLTGKVTGLEIRGPGSLVLIWLPTSLFLCNLERSLTVFCPQLFHLYNIEVELSDTFFPILTFYGCSSLSSHPVPPRQLQYPPNWSLDLHSWCCKLIFHTAAEWVTQELDQIISFLQLQSLSTA